MFPAALDSEAAPADVMVTVWNAEKIGDALALARAARGRTAQLIHLGRRLRVDVYPEADKIGKQFSNTLATARFPTWWSRATTNWRQGTRDDQEHAHGRTATVRREAAAAALLES